MPEQQRRGCWPRPSFPCSPAQTGFQVPSALESTLQAIQALSTCHSSCRSCYHHIHVACMNLLRPALLALLSPSSLLSCGRAIVTPRDAAIWLLARHTLFCRHSTDTSRLRGKALIATERQNGSTTLPRLLSGKARAQEL